MTVSQIYGLLLGLTLFSSLKYWLVNRKLYGLVRKNNISYSDAVKELNLDFPYTIARAGGSITRYYDSKFRYRLYKIRVALSLVICMVMGVFYIVLRLSKYAPFLSMKI